MKKNFKRTLAKVMAIALTVALAGTTAPEANAAKKIKLSNKSITVTKGKTKKVTIKNVKAKKVKKLTVKSSKKTVATVKKSGKTAIKVTGKKAGNAKITVSVTVKGKKKATKLTLSVKVKNPATPKVTAAPTTAPTVAPTTAPTVAPTPTATSDNGGNNGGNNNGGNNNGGDNGGENVETKALKLDLVSKNRTSFIAPNYYADLEFYKENAYSFKSTSQYNTGMGMNVDANGDPVDVSQYKYLKVVLDCEAEVALNLYDSSATSYWSKVDTYEGQVAMVRDADKLTGLRVVYVPLIDAENANNGWNDNVDLTEIVSVSINPNDAEGKSITVYSIEFTDEYIENEVPAVPENLTPAVVRLSLTPENRTTFISETYYADLKFYEENAYSFKSTSQYNTGMGMNVDANGDPVDVSQYKYLKVVLDSEAEVALNLYDSSATSYWSKVDTYEGQVAMVRDADKLTGLRVVYVPLIDAENANNGWNDNADLTEIVSVSINPNNAEGKSITVYSIEFTDEYIENEVPSVPEELTPIGGSDNPPIVEVETPEVTIKASADTIAVEESATVEVKAEAGTIESVVWTVSDKAIVETSAVDGSKTKIKVNPKAAGTATVTATVTVKAEGKTFTVVVKKVIEVTAAEDTLEDYVVDLTGAAAQGYGTSPEVSVDKGVATVTVKGYNNGIKVSVTLPSEVDITDYYGVSMKITSEDKVEYKNAVVELKNKDSQYLQGPEVSDNVNIFSKQYSIDPSQSKEKVISGAFDFKDIGKAEATSGTFDIVIGGMNTNASTSYTISEVKFLAKEPTV